MRRLGGEEDAKALVCEALDAGKSRIAIRVCSDLGFGESADGEARQLQVRSRAKTSMRNSENGY